MSAATDARPVGAKDPLTVLRSAMAATHSPSDRLAYALDVTLVAHPEWCSTDADYPGWIPGAVR